MLREVSPINVYRVRANDYHSLEVSDSRLGPKESLVNSDALRSTHSLGA
jgi:hypothetical protein